ncbi:MAG: hypothetical protein AB7S56_09865 [Halothiobacillaceae bacterium]
MSTRHFLFLQGPATPFFYRLGLRLNALGYRSSKVQFNAGDTVYWRDKKAHRFTGEIEELPSWCEDLLDRLDVTDIVLFGDRRPVHRPFIERANGRGIRVHVFEEGYFRPHWITLERGGVNGHSQLPTDASWYLDVVDKIELMPARMPFKMPFSQRALHDVMYHAAGALNPVLFPHYRTHALYTAPQEYAGYLWRNLKMRNRQP